MTNPYAGEVRLVIDGTPHRLRLTLGALAELEAAMQADTILALVERFESGQIAARDVLVLIVAGLRGGGWKGQAADLLEAEIEGGLPAAAQAAAELLARAFTPANAA
ncbi:MAG: gene transfer agent family protein [Rhodobacteraceae bacterium]|nr:gene transfer agent family protein [Paracoccaceae bacterium]